jgi:hypothetical protein
MSDVFTILAAAGASLMLLWLCESVAFFVSYRRYSKSVSL